MSYLSNVTNMKTSKILPVNWRYSLGLFSPSDGTPANRERVSAFDSARTNNRAPTNAKFLNKNCMSHKILYAIVWKCQKIVSLAGFWNMNNCKWLILKSHNLDLIVIPARIRFQKGCHMQYRPSIEALPSLLHRVVLIG